MGCACFSLIPLLETNDRFSSLRDESSVSGTFPERMCVNFECKEFTLDFGRMELGSRMWQRNRFFSRKQRSEKKF